MIRTGVDIVEISRFSNMKKAELFQKYSFTEREREYFFSKKNPWQSIAGAFAVKEAFSKFIGSGLRGFGLKDIEVLHNESGKPYILFCGKKVDADVSISHSDEYAVAVVCGNDCVRVTDEDIRLYGSMLPKRYENSHKGDCGRVFVVAGSLGMLGAACLCSKAAMRTGGGLVTLGTPECIQPYASIKLTEVMTYPLDCCDGKLSREALPDIIEKVKNCDVCAIGPGLGRSEDVSEIVREVLKCDTPCVVDADALNAVSYDVRMLKDRKCDVVMTPHPGEMSRLTGLSIAAIEKDRQRVALDFSGEYGVTLILKGHNTVIASPDGRLNVNKTGNSGMASGGMGDVLTGVTASLIGQGVRPYEAAVLGAYLHGLAGDIAADDIGSVGIIASDVADRLPFAIESLKSDMVQKGYESCDDK